MVDIDQRIIDEWRELGFYYDLKETEYKKEWMFYGGKRGLQNFVKVIEVYTNDPVHNVQTEHAHYGPYSYLKNNDLGQANYNRGLLCRYN